MNKPVTKPTKAKAQISAGAFGALRAASGDDTSGEAIRILLSNIDEDPNQPRKHFDADELQSLADTIKEHGVVQAIVVRPPVNGRYTLVAGARRWRASKLAGVADIPAIIRKIENDDFAAQVIENQQRSNLTNSELADAVERFAGEGRTTKQIGAICNLKDYQVAAFRKAGEFPSELRARLDTSDMRGLYDLYRQWVKTPDAVIAALPDVSEPLTVTDVRRIVGTITGKVEGFAAYQGKGAAPAAEPQTPAPAPIATETDTNPAPANPPAPATEDEGQTSFLSPPPGKGQGQRTALAQCKPCPRARVVVSSSPSYA
ncbi:ParB/RepB/Spo0J family partition protein [Sphingomonas sp. H160509]|uniref:ParB/RepB/Spo0J family partition protein n=1 Tax=Sphingomonas sp. H160509 TaxID=2955313 RepID=UPI002096B69A|nr:ParB/RepB/Spo0J family partition protein [Sphingomonas sp. H160509]MDD1453321.1 ParB/RepB/Spo0J family partition protein [Sphingomonas sp. H160509]